MLLMLQNPRQHPRRHAPSRVQCSLTGAGLPGQARLDAGRASPTGPCCASAGRPGADKRPKGAADRNGAGTRSASSVTRHVADGVTRPIGDHQPVLIWRNALDQVESSLTGRMPPKGVEYSRSGAFLPMVRILSEEPRRKNTSPTTPPSTMPGTEPRPTRCVQ